MQAAAMSGVGWNPPYPHLCRSRAASLGFPQLGVLNSQAPSKSLLLRFEQRNISAKKETDFPAACGAGVGDKHIR